MRMKRILFSACGAVLTLLMILTLMEIAARLRFEEKETAFGTWEPKAEFDYDEILGWKGIPGHVGSRVDPFTGEIIPSRINAHGYRDRDWDAKLRRAKEAGGKKILFIGDSVLYGWNIPVEDRVTEQLEHVYGVNGKVVVTFNAGIPSFGTDQELRALELLYPVLQPDIVVLWFCSNDVGDACLPYDHRYPLERKYKPYYDVNGSLVLNEKVPRRFSVVVRNTWFQRFRMRYLIDAFQYVVDDIVYRLCDVPENRIISLNKEQYEWGRTVRVRNMDSVLFGKGFEDLFHKNIMRNLNLMKRMNAICRCDDTRFVVCLNSSRNHPHMEQICRFLEQERIEFTNEPYPHFCSFVNQDGHPNFFGNYQAAVKLYSFLENERLEVDATKSGWWERLPSEIDFSNGGYGKFLFDGWGPVEAGLPKGRWMSHYASAMLAIPDRCRSASIKVEGFSRWEQSRLGLLHESYQVMDEIVILSGAFGVRLSCHPVRENGLVRFALYVKHSEGGAQHDQPQSGDYGTDPLFIVRLQAECLKER